MVTVSKANNLVDDKSLNDSGVKYLPWVGEHYNAGFLGKRLLVLGESHYDKWEDEKHELGQNITRECIQDVFKRDGAQFWRYLEQALLNQGRKDGWAPSGGEPLWNQFAFFNFVQSPVQGGPRVRPTWEQFIESRMPLRAVLEELQPERLLVCGKGLWGSMEEIPESDCLCDDIQAYRLNNDESVWCLATVHPSSGHYSWSKIHKLFVMFMINPAEASLYLKNGE